MTEENQRKLYNHFVSTEQKERAKEVLTRYPHFKKEETKSKGKD